MTKDKLSKLREAYLASTRAKGRTDGEEIWQGYMDRWAAVEEQAAADQPLVRAFLAAYGGEPQSIRALNTIAVRWGGDGARDASAQAQADASPESSAYDDVSAPQPLRITSVHAGAPVLPPVSRGTHDEDVLSPPQSPIMA